MNMRWIMAVLVGYLALSALSARAAPLLQIYLEGGQYDPATESWVLTPDGSSGGAPFRLWTIGNTAGPGSGGPIEDVRLSVAYGQDHLGLSIQLTPSRAGGADAGEFQGFTDPSLPIAPSLNTGPVNTSLGFFDTGTTGVVTNGGSPVLYGGGPLPAHGVFGEGMVWQEYDLGDFTLADSHVGDFIGGFPVDLYPRGAQINVYEVSVIGGEGATVHFDLYNHVEAGTRGKFAPFSHDGDGTVNIIPEPATAAIWLVFAGVMGAGAGIRRLRRTATKV